MLKFIVCSTLHWVRKAIIELRMFYKRKIYKGKEKLLSCPIGCIQLYNSLEALTSEVVTIFIRWCTNRNPYLGQQNKLVEQPKGSVDIKQQWRLVSDASVWTHLFLFLFWGFSPIKKSRFLELPSHQNNHCTSLARDVVMCSKYTPACNQQILHIVAPQVPRWHQSR